MFTGSQGRKLRRNRIEHVIVAARARHRHREEAFAHHVDAVVDDVVRIFETLADREKTKRRERAVILAIRDFVRGDLLDDELVVRLPH